MVNWLGGAFIVVVFFGLLKVFKVIAVSKEVIALSGSVMSTMNSDMSDLEKEKAMQSFSIRLFKYFFGIMIGSVLAIGIPLLLIWLLQLLGLVSFDEVLETTLTWEFITLSCLVGVALLAIPKFRS